MANLKKRNLQTKIESGGVGTPVVQMVGAGKVDFGIASADEIVIARSRGSDVVALFTVYQTAPMALMVRSDRGIKEISGIFESGSLAMQKGLPYSLFLEKKFGFDKIKVVPFLGGITQYLSDPSMAQQCFITAEPVLAAKKGKKAKAFLIADTGFNPYTTVLITRRSFLEKEPAISKAMFEASQAGWKAYLANPRPANKLMAKLNPTLDLDTFDKGATAQKALIETSDTKSRGLGTMSKDHWSDLATQIEKLHLATQTSPGDSYFYKF